MPDKTAQQLVVEVEKMIYQSAGNAVQIYSEALILGMIQQAFTHVFDHHYWPRFTVRETLTLDGTTGQTTVAPTFIKEYGDIRYVYPQNYNRPLRILPTTLNTGYLNSGGLAQYVEASGDAKLIRVWPMTATGTVQLLGRKRPPDFILADTVPFDWLVLAHFAAWSYFADDGSSPNATQKHQGLFEARLKDIEKREYEHPIQLNNSAFDIPDRWSEYP